jgi:O-antigen ligase
VYRAKAAEVQSKGPLTNNPHNQYLFLAVELGVPGLLLFLGLLFAAWREAARLEPESALFLRGLVLTMAVSCMVNSFLLDGPEGRAFVLLLALSLMGRRVASDRPPDCT